MMTVVSPEEPRKSNIPLLTAAYLAAGTTGGTTYAFGLYGAALKHSLDLTQSQLDTISSANFCAGLLSWIPGIIVDRYGPRFGVVSGGVLGGVALTLYWIVAREFITLPHVLIVPILCLLGVLIFTSSALITGSVFKIIVGTCGPGNKGSAVGAAKGYVGLGAGAYASLFESLRTSQESDLDFLPMAAVFIMFAATLPALLLLPSKKYIELNPSHDKIRPLHLRLLYISLIGLAVMVISTSLSELKEPKARAETADSGGPYYARALFILLCWFAPILCLLFVPTLDEEDPEDVEEQGVVVTEQDAQPLNEEAPSRHAAKQEDRNLWQMLQTATAWLFVWTSVILVGGGTIMTNNMGQMVEALRFSPVVTAASLALFSVAQAFARVLTGAASEFALKKNIARPFFLVLASLAGVASHALLAVATTEGPFVVGVALSGFAFGMVWPLMVLIIGEVFGTAHVGANYMFYDGFSSAMGTLAISKFVAQSVYEKHITEGGHACFGQNCFETSHWIVVALSLSCVLTSVGMLRTTRETYGGASYEVLSTHEEEKCHET